VQLRPYQVRAIEMARDSYAKGNRAILLVAPTGAGKTVMFSALAESAISKGGRGLVLAHRTELVDQAADKLRALGLDVGIIKAGVTPKPGARIQVASTQTLLGRELPTASFVIVDEAHHYPREDTEWGSLVAAYKGATIFGFTATPERGDGSGLEQFEDLIVVAQPRELIDQGYLVPVEVYRPDSVSKTLAMDPVKGYLKFGVVDGEKRKAIVFPGSIKAGNDIAHRLDRLGVPSACITQSTPSAVRAILIERFRLGSLRVLVGVHVLTEGLDVPDAFLAILGTRCASPGSLVQKTGRVLRPAPGKTFARVLDLMGATHLHGLPDDDRDFSLSGKAMATGSKLPAQVTCDACGRVFRANEFTDNVCPSCGAIKRGKVDRRVQDRAVELAKASRAAKYPPQVVRFVAEAIQSAKRTVSKTGKRNGRKIVQMRFLSQFHHYPSNALVERAGGWQGL